MWSRVEDFKQDLTLVGLGNITHHNTRHNVGMMVLDQIVKQLDLSWSQSRAWKSDTTTIQLSVASKKEVKEYSVTFLKPRRLMNVSGTCVAQAVKDLSVPLTNVFVFHDDMQRELGKVSLKASGSANGHNGIKSIIEHLKKDDFKRIRIGIGRPKIDDRSHEIVANFVLGKFSSCEMEKLESLVYPLWTTNQGFELLCDQGLLKTPAKKKQKNKNDDESKPK